MNCLKFCNCASEIEIDASDFFILGSDEAMAALVIGQGQYFCYALIGVSSFPFQGAYLRIP